MKKIFVLYVGGTIGMVETKNGLKPAPLKELRKYLTNIDNLAILKLKSCKKIIDSSNIKPKNWIKIAKEIKKVYNDYDGFIILHGTDTLAYSSSMLSFMFKNLSKPIVFTGSQLPISNPRSDGVLNFVNSIFVAKKNIPEVLIVFGDKILRANRATKVSTTSFNAFNSLNFPPLGIIEKDIKIDTKLLLKKSDKKLKLDCDINENVANILLTPSSKPKYLKKILLNKKIKGIVIESFGSGNMPENKKFLKILKKAKKMKKLIVNITQSTQGSVEIGLYKSSSKLQKMGVINGFDMSLEASITKLMWVLNKKNRVKKYKKNLRGEIKNLTTHFN